MKRVEVENCLFCPFMWDGRDMGDCHRCTAMDLGDEFKELRSFRGEWQPGRVPPPPRWCPLRRADHLVTLRVK